MFDKWVNEYKKQILRIISPSCPGPILMNLTIIVSIKVQFYKHLLADYPVISEVLSMSSGVRQTWVQVPALSFTSCVTLGNSFKLSELHLFSYKLWIMKCLTSWYWGEDCTMGFFNRHSKLFIPCFSLMCVNWIDSIYKILSPVISKRTNKITNVLCKVLINVSFPSFLFPSSIRSWNQLILRLKNSSTIEKWWQPDVVLSSYYMFRTVISNNASVSIPVINAKYQLLSPTLEEISFSTSNKVSLKHSPASSFRELGGRLCVPSTTLASFVIWSSSVMKQVIEIMGSWLLAISPKRETFSAWHLGVVGCLSAKRISS